MNNKEYDDLCRLIEAWPTLPLITKIRIFAILYMSSAKQDVRRFEARYRPLLIGAMLGVFLALVFWSVGLVDLLSVTWRGVLHLRTWGEILSPEEFGQLANVWRPVYFWALDLVSLVW